MYVIQHKETGEYFRTIYYGTQRWENNIDDARTYRTKGAVENSRTQQGIRTITRVVHVKPVSVDTINQFIDLAKQSRGNKDFKAAAFDLQNA